MTYFLKSNRTSETTVSDCAKIFFAKAYKETTQDVQVTVWPEFLDSRLKANDDIFIWSYYVRIDNKSRQSLRLIERYWQIIDEKGKVQEILGEGIMEEHPVIAPNAFYQYDSGVRLEHPSGIMTGRYKMQDDQGKIFEVKIPTFSLDVPNLKLPVN